MTIPASGPRTAKIVIVGEAPGADEIRLGEPFVGSSGYELTRMLHEAGIIRSECFITNVANERPPGNDISLWLADSRADAERKGFTDEHFGKRISTEVRQGIDRLAADLLEIKPNLIIALGNTPLWALTGHDGITDWRGSILECKLVEGLKVLPTYHPASVLRVYEWRALVVHDLKRAVQESEFPDIRYPCYYFLPSPSFPAIIANLVILRDCADKESKPLFLSVDFETIRHEIACVGIAWSRLAAICIPFRTSREYWTIDEEIEIVQAIRRLLTHPNVRCIFQNGLYDMQYFIRKWGFWPNYADDTMIAHHVAFAGMPKDLSFLSSMYCEFHQHWKEDLKDWRKAPDDDLKFFTYNCKDCVITFEVMETLRGVLKSLNLTNVYDFQMELCHDVLDIMLRGVAVDLTRRSNLASELMAAAEQRAEFVRSVVGYELNPKSPKQMQSFLYDEMGCKEVRNRKTGRTTANFEALQIVAEKNPILLPISDAILDLRSIGVFLSTFVQAPLDVDKRLRCSYNPAGTETFRLSSSENAFGSGLNLQNVSEGNRPKGSYQLPNIKIMFAPEPGFTFFDIDLDRADLQVVVWEANDSELKQMLREGVDMHLENAKVLFGNPHLTKKSRERQVAKKFVHGCVTAGHEMLTPQGWIPVEDYEDGTPIMIWNSDGTMWFEIPQSFNRDLAVSFVSFAGETYDAEMTYDHRVPYKLDSEGILHVTQAFAVPTTARLPMTGYYTGSLDIPWQLARLICAYHADGVKDPTNIIRFRFKRDRKIQRMHLLLYGLDYETIIYKDGVTEFRIHEPLIKLFGSGASHLMLHWTAEALDAYLTELVFWDGSNPGTALCHVMTIDKQHAEWCQTLSRLRGYGSQFAVQRLAGENRQELYRVSLNNRRYARMSSMQIAHYETEPRAVYCPQVSTGFFLLRRNGKIMVTGNTNYGGGARTIAGVCGVLVHVADQMQKRWFAAHPGIKDWHVRTEAQLRGRRFVTNRFGYRRFYFGRVEGLLPQALAWIPQSTVACVTNRALHAIHRTLSHRDVNVLLQVHDSIAGQYRTSLESELLPQIHRLCLVPIPYPDPLTIPVGLKTSTASWGACSDRDWGDESAKTEVQKLV